MTITTPKEAMVRIVECVREARMGRGGERAHALLEEAQTLADTFAIPFFGFESVVPAASDPAPPKDEDEDFETSYEEGEDWRDSRCW